MKTNFSHHCQHALTIIELLLVMTMLVLLVLLLLPALAGRSLPARRIKCVSNLKQIGLGFRIWSNDSSDKFPFARSTNDGGTLEFAESTNVFLHFRAISNELSTPKILVCPSDSSRQSAKDFNKFDNRNISYFIGLDAAEAKPGTILSGDRNLSTNGLALGSGVFTLTTSDALGWTPAIHKSAGNIGLADGSVQQVSSQSLQAQWLAVTNVVRRLAIP